MESGLQRTNRLNNQVDPQSTSEAAINRRSSERRSVKENPSWLSYDSYLVIGNRVMGWTRLPIPSNHINRNDNQDRTVIDLTQNI